MCSTEISLVFWRPRKKGMEGTSGAICGRRGLGESWEEKFMEVFLARSASGAQRCQSVNVSELQVPAQGNRDIHS